MLDLMNGGKCMSGVDAVEFFERLAESEDIYIDVKTPEFCDEYEYALNRLRYEVRKSAALEKALELACNDAADEQCPHEFDLYTCEKCADCPHGGEIHTDAERDAQCWKRYYIQRGQKQEDDH